MTTTIYTHSTQKQPNELQNKQHWKCVVELWIAATRPDVDENLENFVSWKGVSPSEKPRREFKWN
jgi:hypothetical protein